MANTLSYKKIFLFWIPLAITWLMMSVEGPYLSALIARMGDPKYNLAAFGISFSFALIVEAPVIMLMSAATALVDSYNSFQKLKTFTYILNTLITLFMLVILIPSVFNFIAVDLIDLPIEVVEITYWAFAALLPWPAAIGYRRFYQGILIIYSIIQKNCIFWKILVFYPVFYFWSRVKQVNFTLKTIV